MRLAALLIGAGALAEAAPPDALTAGLEAPGRGVVCHRARGICYDRYGPSIGLTEAFLGRAAADALTARLRQIPPPDRLGTTFSPADGVECVRETGPCRVNDQLAVALSAALFGPSPTGNNAAER